MVTISIIGIGRVGGALALALPKQKYAIRNLIYRSDPAQKSLIPDAVSCRLDDISGLDSDIIFISTQDSEIATVAKDLVSKLKRTPFVFHNSGALSSEALACLRGIGCKTGSLHPLVSISDATSGPERFAGSYFCVEGETDAVDMAKTIVADLGGIPFLIDTKFKTLYHASAVTACGHLVALFDAAVEMMTKCGVSGTESKKILLPLVKSTVTNLAERETADALTGTFARADIDTFVEHLKTLNTNVSDQLLEIYLLLGERSLELAAKRGVNSQKIDTMRAKVSIAKSKVKW
jgi:predicted short-subunit dehydrogenase-like oxidoreductase (DUF2520 family)